MKNIGNHEFEYYEEQAAYFQYTHDRDVYEDDISEEYLRLDASVIEMVQQKVCEDYRNGRKSGRRELENYLLDQGIVKYGQTAPIIDDLYVDYEMAFIGAESLEKSRKY